MQARERWREDARVLVLEGEGWHEGVRGIVATRVAAQFGVPVMVFSVEDDEARGSGRSIGTVDLHRALAQASGILTRFGGHAAAVGATLPAANLGRLTEILEEALASETREAYETITAVDAEIGLAEATRELAGEIRALAPFGEGNPQPLLGCRGAFLNGRKRVGDRGDHLRFEAFDGAVSVPAIAFRCRDVEDLARHEGPADLAFCLETDTWKGHERVQLLVRAIVAREIGAGADALVDELFADAERVLARGEYEHVEESESFHTKLAGVTFEGRQEVVARLGQGALLRLERQPDNEYDPNAIALFDAVGDHVGFFNRRLAAALAPVIDRGAVFEVSVTEVTGAAEETRGVNVLVERADRRPEAETDEGARLARRAELGALSPVELDDVLVSALIGDRVLHDAQRASLEHLAAGRSCLTVMATGRGKSLIFHLHAARIALARGEASVFVYPLRALVADQSFHLDEVFSALGLFAAVLTGETSAAGRDEVFESLAAGRCDVVMTTPEFLERHAARFAASGRVRFLVVDEAHHVGMARSGRRPAYARLGPVLDALSAPTVCALTATASDEVARIVRETLRIENVVTDGTVRANLRVDDRRGTTDKAGPIAALAARGGKTIVYVNSREQSVRMAQRLRALTPALEHRVAFYNGGMSRSARHAVEQAFRDGRIGVVVATSAFGEGIDIPDVRHIALIHLPFNAVEFNQMCGRAGRDGGPAWVHLLFGGRDARLNEIILESSAPDLDDLRALYSVVRGGAQAAEGGWLEATNSGLAEQVKRSRPRARLTDRGVSTAIGIFRECGLLDVEGAGLYRRMSVLSVDGRVDLTSSVRYAEGLDEIEAFDAFRLWALESPAKEMLEAFDRPILPAP